MNKNDYCNLDSSYLLEVNPEEKKRFEDNESKEKQKYINNTSFSKDKYLPGVFKTTDQNKDTNVDVDSFLRYPPNLYHNKTSVELNKNLDPKKYDILYSNNLKKNPLAKKNIAIINDKPYIGAGRGIGDLDVSELIRTGQDTRRYNDKFKEKQESNIIDRFKILDKNFQDPKNVIMEIPRGGIQTRKTKKNINKNDKFNFNY